VELSFAVPRRGPVNVAVFDLMGRRVRLLEAGIKSGGAHRTRWDGRDEAGTPQRDGIYLVRMEAAGSTWTRKIVLAR
jgi:flagellar hook assembly protein FlgD